MQKKQASLVTYPKREFATACLFDDFPICSVVIGVTEPFPEYVMRRSKNPTMCTIEYVESGEGEIIVDGIVKNVCAGDTYLLRENQTLLYRASRKNPYRKLWINIYLQPPPERTCAYLPAMLNQYGLTTDTYSVDTSHIFRSLLDLSAGKNTTDTYLRISEAIHNLVIMMAMSRRTEFYPGVYHTIRDILRNSAYTKISLSTLADQFNMSKTSLIRGFRDIYGVTPYEFLLDTKIEAAKLLLLNTQLGQKEIADRLCLCDEHYFSALFYKRTGLRPTQYVKKKNGG